MTRWIGIHSPGFRQDGIAEPRAAPLNCASETSNSQSSTTRGRATARPLGKPAIRRGAGRRAGSKTAASKNYFNVRTVQFGPAERWSPAAYAVWDRGDKSRSETQVVVPLLVPWKEALA